MPTHHISVNGVTHAVDAPDDMPLLWVLRHRLGLFGTKYGCGIGVCGACTVHEDGRAVRSCQVRVATATAHRYTTIEGLSPDATHPCQRAWIAEDVAQCGYCQPGMVMEAAALIARVPAPRDADIDAAFGGHVCRCGTYDRLRRAVHRAAALATEQR